MDTPEAITHVSLCAGYGGIDLGLKRVLPNLRTVAFSEIEGYACANLVAKMEAGQLDPAPIWTNLKTFPWGAFHGRVDILSGGYPCQPFSSAGKRLGADDPRHLWPYIAAGIAAMRPRVCFFENVEGHISLGLENVLRDLQGLGYACTFGVFSAAEVGAPHQRKRVFIMAHCVSGGSRENLVPTELRANGIEQSPSDCGRCGASATGQVGKSGVGLADTGCTGLQGYRKSGNIKHTERRQGQDRYAWPSGPRQQQHCWEPSRTVDDAGSQEQHGLPESTERDGDAAAWITSEVCMGSPMHSGSHGSTGSRIHGTGRVPIIASERCSARQAQPPMGGNPDGRAGRLDYGELCRSGDNRTDELRLLGNGVVPATAARAWVVLNQRLSS